MAMTLKQKEILNYQLGVLEGLCWVATMDEKMHPIAECLDSVRDALQKVLDEDGGADDGCKDRCNEL